MAQAHCQSGCGEHAVAQCAGVHSGKKYTGKFCGECAYQLALHACENNAEYSRKPLKEVAP